MRILRPSPAAAPRLRMRNALLPSALLLSAAALASGPLAAQQVYQWRDAAGVAHFSAQPPSQGQHYEARPIDPRDTAPPAAAADGAKPAQAEDTACAAARANLALLQGNAQLMVDSDGDGKPDKALSAADREKQRKLAEAMIAVKCADGARARTPEPEEG